MINVLALISIVSARGQALQSKAKQRARGRQSPPAKV